MTRIIRRDSSTDRDGNVTFFNERFASLSAELKLLLAEFFKRNTLEAYDGTYPTDIDDHHARYDPGRVMVAHLKREGFTDREIADITPIQRAMFKFFMDIAINSHIFGHGKPPGMPDVDADFEEPI